MLNIGSIVWGVRDLPRAPDDDWAVLVPTSGTGAQLALKLVSSERGRRHPLDLYAEDQQAEVERLLALGATRPEWRYEPDAD